MRPRGDERTAENGEMSTPRHVRIWKIVRSPAEPRNIGFCSEANERSIHSSKPRGPRQTDSSTHRTCSAAMSVVVLEKPHHVSSPPFT